MKKPSLRVVSYVRDRNVRTGKFSEFDRLVKGSEGKVDAVLVASPEVLGDTYEELIGNLDKLAAAQLRLVIVPPSERAVPKRTLN